MQFRLTPRLSCRRRARSCRRSAPRAPRANASAACRLRWCAGWRAEQGLFSIWLARALGGPELGLVDFFRVIGELARADGAAGWCATVSAGYSRFSGFLTEKVARDIFGGGTTIMAGTINPTGKAVAVPGGFRVSGRWAYGSFIQHSSWTVGNCWSTDGDAPRRGADGAPDMRLMLFPTREVEIIDTWRVAGLRGTGSHDFQVRDLFVPEDHAIAGFAAKPMQPGTLYTAPNFITVFFAMCLASVPLGIARRKTPFVNLGCRGCKTVGILMPAVFSALTVFVEKGTVADS